MNTDLNREQIMMIVERARYQRSLAAGDVYAVSNSARRWSGWPEGSTSSCISADVAHREPLKTPTRVVQGSPQRIGPPPLASKERTIEQRRWFCLPEPHTRATFPLQSSDTG